MFVVVIQLYTAYKAHSSALGTWLVCETEEASTGGRGLRIETLVVGAEECEQDKRGREAGWQADRQTGRWIDGRIDGEMDRGTLVVACVCVCVFLVSRLSSHLVSSPAVSSPLPSPPIPSSPTTVPCRC